MRPRPSGLAVLALLAACSTTPPPPAPAPAPAPAPEPPPQPVIPAPEPPPPPAASLRLAFVGDVNLGTVTLPNGVPPEAGRGLLDAARPYLTGDLVVGNFEGVLADSGTSVKCGPPPDPTAAGRRRASRAAARAAASRKPAPPRRCYAFRTPTLLAPRLREAGFTHLNLANNHANDFGLAGRRSTEATLRAESLAVYGPIGQIAIDTVRRGDSLTTIGLVGFTTYPHSYNLLDVERSAVVVDSVRPLVQVLVVTFHGGTEGPGAVRTADGPELLGDEPRGDLRRWARAVIDAGADAVVGHGPHVLRGVEFYRGRPIVYSLGNFLTYRGFGLSGPLGVTGVLQLELGGDGGFRSARLVPMVQLPARGPAPDSSARAIELVRRVSEADFGPTAARVAPDGTISPP